MYKHLPKIMPWAVIASELGHVFCCVLPTLFSVLTLLAGIGLLSVVPGFIIDLHEAMHEYELVIIGFSCVITLLAWLVYMKADNLDCHSTGCGHGPCDTRKNRAGTILKVGTILLVVNIFIFVFFHYLPYR